ncbi:hypothetical protein HPB47_025638 [Ixodes persulcatus]|uniref:Uncharacterized protein n=1 Tax=Ixodes persulcatus TaxID=34615 RepID=A0AC60Q2P6_IXOPE|nr:hypothetical protein HPB47_025638 [Ixodes persulcatus]
MRSSPLPSLTNTSVGQLAVQGNSKAHSPSKASGVSSLAALVGSTECLTVPPHVRVHTVHAHNHYRTAPTAYASVSTPIAIYNTLVTRTAPEPETPDDAEAQAVLTAGKHAYAEADKKRRDNEDRKKLTSVMIFTYSQEVLRTCKEYRLKSPTVREIIKTALRARERHGIRLQLAGSGPPGHSGVKGLKRYQTVLLRRWFPAMDVSGTPCGPLAVMGDPFQRGGGGGGGGGTSQNRAAQKRLRALQICKAYFAVSVICEMRVTTVGAFPDIFRTVAVVMRSTAFLACARKKRFDGDAAEFGDFEQPFHSGFFSNVYE